MWIMHFVAAVGAAFSQLSGSGQTLSEDSGVDIAESGGLSKESSPRPGKARPSHEAQRVKGLGTEAETQSVRALWRAARQPPAQGKHPLPFAGEEATQLMFFTYLVREQNLYQSWSLGCPVTPC